MKKYLAVPLAVAFMIALLGTPIAAHAQPIQQGHQLVRSQSWSYATEQGTQLSVDMVPVEQPHPPCVIVHFEPCSMVSLNPVKQITVAAAKPAKAMPLAYPVTPAELGYHRDTVAHMHYR